MPLQFGSPRFERVFVQPQTTFNTVPNGTGTWTTTGAKLLRTGTNGCKLVGAVPMIEVPWKTGTRSTQPGIAGRKNAASWALSNVPIIPSGTAGMAPDMDALLGSIFGAVGVATPSTSVVYSFSDTAFVPLVLARFQHSLTTLTNQFAFGCLTSDASFTINSDVFEMSASGPAYWVLDSENWANEDTNGKGGLTSFPSEISSPTTTGSIMQGFVGTATFDGTALTTATAPLIAATIRVRTGNGYNSDAFGSSYPALPVGGQRAVSISFSVADTDATILNTLKTKAKAKTAIDITIQVGTTAGSIASFALKSVQLAVPEYSDDNTRVVTAFGESMAHGSAIGNVDDLVLTLT